MFSELRDRMNRFTNEPNLQAQFDCYGFGKMLFYFDRSFIILVFIILFSLISLFCNHFSNIFA